MKNILLGFIVLFIGTSILFGASAVPLKAQDEDEESALSEEVSKKLDQVLKNQKTILDGIESLKQELYIVKIRVTQKQ